MAWRAVRSSRVTDTAALALTASKSTSMAVVRNRLSPQCSCTSGAPGCRPASMSWTTGRDRNRRSISARQILGLGPGRRHAHGHQLADIANLARGQDRLHRRLEAGQRGVGADGRHALQILGDEHTIANCRLEFGSP